MDIILASSSPRRKRILETLGLRFKIVTPDIDESILDGEKPIEYARRVSLLKAEKVLLEIHSGRQQQRGGGVTGRQPPGTGESDPIRRSVQRPENHSCSAGPCQGDNRHGSLALSSVHRLHRWRSEGCHQRASQVDHPQSSTFGLHSTIRRQIWKK